MRYVAMLAILPAVALGVTVEPLQQSEYADTEVSTNIPFEVRFDTMSRMNFRLRKSRLDAAWNLVKVTRRGVAEIGEVALVEGAKPGKAVIVR